MMATVWSWFSGLPWGDLLSGVVGLVVGWVAKLLHTNSSSSSSTLKG